MQLPREALREYKELEAIIPVGSTSRDGDTAAGNLNPAEAKLILDLATAAGHSHRSFSSIIRKIKKYETN